MSMHEDEDVEEQQSSRTRSGVVIGKEVEKKPTSKNMARAKNK